MNRARGAHHHGEEMGHLVCGRRVTFRPYFLSRSTARGARTIMARKSGTGVLLLVALWLYFRSRSTVRRARTIILRKSGIGVPLPVALWLYFLSRSTARGARTIMARKSGTGVLLLVALWLYFRSRSTARAARTIMGRKCGPGVLLSVMLWSYFLNSVRTSAGHLVQHVPMKAPQARRTPVRTFDRNNRKFTSGRLRSSHQICQARCAAITSIPIA